MAAIGTSWASNSWIGSTVWKAGTWESGAWVSGSVWGSTAWTGWKRYSWGTRGWGESGWLDGSWADQPIIPPVAVPTLEWRGGRAPYGVSKEGKEWAMEFWRTWRLREDEELLKFVKFIVTKGFLD